MINTLNNRISVKFMQLEIGLFTANFYQRCKQENTRSTVKYFIVPAFSLSGKSNYVVEEFNAERQCAMIWWDHYLTTEGEAGSGGSLPIPHRTHSDPIPRFETVQSHFQTESEN